MPLRFRIDAELGIVLTTAKGRVTPDDLAEHARELAKTPNRPRREMVDLSLSGEADIPAAAVRATARFLEAQDVNQPGSRLALVAQTDALFGLLRLYAAHRENDAVQTEVFRDRDEALRWLCADPGGDDEIGADSSEG